MSDQIEKLDDYNDDLELFLSQFQDSTKLKAIMESANNSANDIETALFETRDNFYINTAKGEQLDIIGSVFNEERNGDIDIIYRQRIKQKATVNYSGTPEEIIEIVQGLYGAIYVYYRPAYPGKYYLLTDVILISEDLNPNNPAGVSALIEQYLVDGAGNYIVDGNGNKITCVIEIELIYLLDGNNNSIVDGNNNLLSTIG